jgi:hypothetical protein
MKKAVIILAIAFLITAVFISGCQTGTEKETIVVTEETGESAEADTGEFVGGPMSCEDTDGGKDKETKGTVSGVDIDGKEYEFDDECVVTWLVEYFCEGDEYKNQNFICDNDCKNGACI